MIRLLGIWTNLKSCALGAPAACHSYLASSTSMAHDSRAALVQQLQDLAARAHGLLDTNPASLSAELASISQQIAALRGTQQASCPAPSPPSAAASCQC